MFPNTWKTLAFGVGLSVAGIALCADQPATLHGGKAKQAETARKDTQEIQPVKFETILPPPAVGTAMQVKEFELELPALPGKEKAETPKIPDLPPLGGIGGEKAALPPIEVVKPEPSRIFEPPAVKFDVPEVPPLPAKPVLVETPGLPTLPVAETKTVPVEAPLPPDLVPLKPAGPERIPSPRIVETVVPETAPIVPVSIPKPALIEVKPISPTPTPVPAPETKPLGNKHKLVVTLGDGKPRFEIRSIETNEVVLSAVADHLEIHPESRYDPNTGRKKLQRLVAEGDITFDAPDAAGSCKCLSILAGTGEVLLQSVDMKMKNQKFSSTIRSDKVVYQIGHGETERTSQK